MSSASTERPVPVRPGSIARSASPSAPPSAPPPLTLSQVKLHDTPEDLWMIVYNKVYDVTKFAKDHPGGREVLFDCGGVDATEAFEDVGHSDDAVNLLAPFFVGDLDPKYHKVYSHIRTPIDLLEPLSHQHSWREKRPVKTSRTSRKMTKQKKLLVERLAIASLCTLSFLAFILCIGLQRLKWSDHLQSH